jgi:hypothetical protein
MKKITLFLLALLLPVFACAGDEKQGDFFMVVPVPSYTPETLWEGFLIAAYMFRPAGTDAVTPSSMAQVSLAYTQLNQSDVFLEFDHYWDAKDWALRAVSEYRKFPDKFYGIGSHGNTAGERFTMESSYMLLEIYRRAFMNLYFGGRWTGMRSVMLASDINGHVPGEEGGNDSGLALLAKWDDRDNIYFTVSGDYLQFSSTLFSGAHNFTKWEADLRHYFRLDGSQSISLQALLQAETGSPPFYLMNMLGGEKIMRGYYKGSYRDRCSAVLQAEYKWMFIPRFVLSVQAAAGAVNSGLADLTGSPILLSCGAGLRFILNERDKMTFRADAGFGRDGMGVYLVAGEAY